MRAFDKNKHQTVEDIMERCAAAVILVCCFPFLLVIAGIIFTTSGLPILFVQDRVGKNGKVFRMNKFRTMRLGAENEQQSLEKLNEAIYPTFKIRNDPRFTSIGRSLSHTGIDEIPQLWNILAGDMSFFGPRPLPIHEDKLLPKSLLFRRTVKPGVLSTWALQRSEHNSLEFMKKADQQDILQTSPRSKLQLVLKYLQKQIEDL